MTTSLMKHRCRVIAEPVMGGRSSGGSREEGERHLALEYELGYIGNQRSNYYWLTDDTGIVRER